MKLKYEHAWDVSPEEAKQIQLDLQSQVILQDDFGEIKYVAGIDVGFENNNTMTRAAVAVLNYDSLQLVEYAIARRKTSFPYVPGFLSFREVPAVLDALNKIQCMPDILLCDGQGIAHPRRFGIACHLGVLTDLPAIGVAKSRLCGRHGTVPDIKGKYARLEDKGEVIGVVLRTRQGVKPLYVSSGHQVSLESSITIVMGCVSKYRLPETTRYADKLASNR